MTRAKIIDIIKSAVGSVLRIDNLAEYKNTYTTADMTNNTLVPFGLVSAIIPTIGGYEVSYTGSSLVINWQTDFVFGTTTFATYFGNNLPKPTHYFFDGVDTYIDGNVKPEVVRIAGVIDTVTFDWGYSTDVVIVF